MLRRRSVRIAAVTAAAWLTVAMPAWANMADPELYPEAAERYRQGMSALFWGTIGCFTLALVVFILAVVLLVRWLIRRSRARSAQDLTPGVPPVTEAPADIAARPEPASERTGTE